MRALRPHQACLTVQAAALSNFYYDAQRVGPLPATNDVSWRNSALTNVTGPGGRDLTGKTQALMQIYRWCFSAMLQSWAAGCLCMAAGSAKPCHDSDVHFCCGPLGIEQYITPCLRDQGLRFPEQQPACLRACSRIHADAASCSAACPSRSLYRSCASDPQQTAASHALSSCMPQLHLMSPPLQALHLLEHWD